MNEPLHTVLLKSKDTTRSSRNTLQLTKILGNFMATKIPCHWEYKDVEVGGFLKNMFRDSDKLAVIELLLSPHI